MCWLVGSCLLHHVSTTADDCGAVSYSGAEAATDQLLLTVCASFCQLRCCLPSDATAKQP